ncbi:ABC transporter ATP-binding protein [Virgisporangium aurantiacum]|uniref:ABC transporter ATP-binding protein n=1 Tax=Virgisporangium aurantiacum TaxID=175570 RepID=A0A8J4E4L0_9ACTN|nr:ABC transporter ATP-binding protein [Virgisporangium aurantiacum]GIJ61346.1 ABC transporter ATP-binding protein [Virgisporangium aurantiacum]
MTRVELRGFGWRHAGRKAWALRDVTLRIDDGERVLLLGASGAGKSTLLAALAGLLAEDSGEQAGTVLVDGKPPRAAEAGMLFQDPQTALVMARAGDDVAFGLENLGVPRADIWPRVDGALAAVGFPYGRDRDTNALSGGEQQRLALAGVLALRPGLLLLDEPTANLDPAGAELIRLLLAGLDTTMILVEHRVAEALPLVERVVVLSPAGVVADGPPADIFGKPGAALAEQGVWVPGPSPVAARSGGTRGGVLLSTRGAALGYPGEDTRVFSDLDLEIAEGEALAVLGPNGAGKTSLALVLGGLLAPTAGSVAATARLAGADAATPPWKWRARQLAGRIGSVFQNPEHQFVTSRVRDEVALGPRRLDRPVPDGLLERLRLAHLAEANPFTLSGGEARRLSVATALAAAPAVLVLDEPTFGQDRRTWIELVDLIADLRDEGRGIVLVTHDEALVMAVADRRFRL